MGRRTTPESSGGRLRSHPCTGGRHDAIAAGGWWRRRVGVLVFAAAAAAGPLQDDLTARGPGSWNGSGAERVAVFWSAPAEGVFARHRLRVPPGQRPAVPHRASTQPDTILVLMPGNRTKREILFVREPDPRREHWNGHKPHARRKATAHSGIETVLTRQPVRAVPRRDVRPAAVRAAPQRRRDEYDTFFDALGAGRRSWRSARSAAGAVASR